MTKKGRQALPALIVLVFLGAVGAVFKEDLGTVLVVIICGVFALDGFFGWVRRKEAGWVRRNEES